MRSLIAARNSIVFSGKRREKARRGGRARYRGLSRSERLTADRAIARAELVGLQAVEDAQHLLGIAADVEVVDADVLDRVVGIDDERRAQRNAFVLVADSELVDERALRIAEAPVAELRQVLV